MLGKKLVIKLSHDSGGCIFLGVNDSCMLEFSLNWDVVAGFSIHKQF